MPSLEEALLAAARAAEVAYQATVQKPTRWRRLGRRGDWRADLDERIDHCPGCDRWRFDGVCKTCDNP